MKRKFMLGPWLRGGVRNRTRLALSVLLVMLGGCATQPTIPDPSTLRVPTKQIIVTEGNLNTPYEVLGSADATLGGMHAWKSKAEAEEAAKQHLRNAAYTKYGERLDAIINVKITPVVAGGFAGAYVAVWGAGTFGARVEGIAVSFKK